MDAGISYAMAYSEFDACVDAGLDLWDWENNVYPKPFKTLVMAWHRANNLIRANIEQAVADKRK